MNFAGPTERAPLVRTVSFVDALASGNGTSVNYLYSDFTELDYGKDWWPTSYKIDRSQDEVWSEQARGDPMQPLAAPPIQADAVF